MQTDDDDPRFLLSHVEVPLLTPRKRADFPPSPFHINRPAKRIRTRATSDASVDLEEVTVVVLDSDGEEVIPQGGGERVPLVEHHRDLNLYGQGLTKSELLEIRSTLGPLEEIQVGGKNHLLSTKHLHQYFYWLAERQRIFERRKEGIPPMLTVDDQAEKDPSLCLPLDPLFALRISNVFRHQDADSHRSSGTTARFSEPDLEYRTSGLDRRYNSEGEWVDTLEEQTFRVTLY